ncbi:hypothetical protein BGW36DRAFT_384726 [Talaromyces proteolyticus]|uniref:Integral membrane protein n=1 Tax=Talaromyces proteolyticus TaxID=1131652 RepID=A0AAD4KQG8_9EURO|nr:uncharacterized protein BGW36DRAFT_384726 [Talaromyces proteolyticus]KAH8694308.1 hypothetical protein BGW36DRAFT_384726 [Talaromyces proteolyticus]
MSYNSSNTHNILVQCPKTSAVVFTTTWYVPINSPAFTVCSKCWEDKIRTTQFAGQFQAERFSADPRRFCLWNSEKMNRLGAATLNDRAWELIRQYMIDRGKIQNCTGPTIGLTASTATGGYSWYSLRNKEISGFVCCEACYSDTVRATAFADKFVLENGGVNGQSVTCDMAISFIKKSLLDNSITQNWPLFIQSAAARMRIPACNSLKGAPCSSTLWYMPNPPMNRILICGACFHDGADLTPMAPSFSQVQVPENRKGEIWDCANSNTVLGMVVAWNEACDKKNVALWHNAASIIQNLPPCTKDGITNGVWYTLSGCPDFKICGRCFVGIIQPFGLGRYFQHTGGPADGSAYICDLFPGFPRAQSYFLKIDEAVGVNDFSIFHNFVARLAPLPPCPKDGPWTNRLWYCGEEATICESCYEEAIRNTSLAGTLTLQKRTEEFICDAYSPRMRRLWDEACAKNNIQSFNVALRERRQVYQATMPRMRMILEMAKMRMNTQATLFMSSTLLQGADNIVSASQSHRTHDYGNSQIGYHWATAAGAQGAMQFQQALNMNIAPTGDMAEMSQLGACWRQYE